MKGRYIFLYLTIAILAETVLMLRPGADVSVWWKIALALLILVLLRLLYTSFIKPISAISKGMDLVRAQDFGSRLIPVGQKDADSLVGLFNDMIGRLRDERVKLNEQHCLTTQLIKVSPMGIAILDFDYRIAVVNKAMCILLGHSDEDSLIGKEIARLSGSVADSLNSLKAGESRIVRSGDSNIYRCMSTWFMDSGFRRRVFLVEILSNEMRQAEKNAYGKAIRLLAHEVNNTMTGVDLMLDTVQSCMTEDIELSSVIDSCRQRCNNMSKFITSYAEVVKIPPIHKTKINLNSRLDGMFSFLESMAPGNITLIKNLAPAIGEITADLTLLEQAIVNIVKNSIESIGDRTDGKIWITTSPNPATLVISDNGPGLSEEASVMIFSPFFSTKPSGQGLGLMFVSEILHRHNFRFSLSTSPDDAITRFSIQFGR